jgi:excisionase family DNA binding protein
MKFYSVSQVAILFDVSHSTVLNWIAKGKLEKEQVVPRGKIRIPETSVPAFKRKNASQYVKRNFSDVIKRLSND